MARIIQLTCGQLRGIIREETRRLTEATDDPFSRLVEDFDVDGLHVHVTEGNTGLVGNFDGTVDGVQVRGRLYYGTSSADSNVLEILGCEPDDMIDRVWQVIDESPEFKDWSDWAMQQADDHDDGEMALGEPTGAPPCPTCGAEDTHEEPSGAVYCRHCDREFHP